MYLPCLRSFLRVILVQTPDVFQAIEFRVSGVPLVIGKFSFSPRVRSVVLWESNTDGWDKVSDCGKKSSVIESGNVGRDETKNGSKPSGYRRCTVRQLLYVRPRRSLKTLAGLRAANGTGRDGVIERSAPRHCRENPDPTETLIVFNSGPGETLRRNPSHPADRLVLSADILPFSSCPPSRPLLSPESRLCNKTRALTGRFSPLLR